MLRKIINLIVVLAVIVAISGIFIHLYNNSKNKPSKFDNIKQTVEKKKNKNKKKQEETSENENNKEEEDNQEDLDDNDVITNEEEQSNNNDESVTTSSEVAVASTGTKENIYLSIIGGIIIITGTGLITLKIK